jgi:RimJ/RimL family protein N-acetyltransferase
MFCHILYEDIKNIENWEKKIRRVVLNKAHEKIFRRYDVKNLDEYIDLIKKNIHNPKDIEKLYKINEYNDRLEMIIKENKSILENIRKSRRYKDKNVKIRLLSEKYKARAIELYKKFKIFFDEEFDDDDEYESHIGDFIIKENLYGLFENNELAGILILNERKFNGLNTFYIQELIVDDKYKNRGYGNLFINYALLRCPMELEYISFMTMPTNIQMIKIAEKFKFILQPKPSGDKKHSLLFIRPNDKIEREFYNNLSHKKSHSSPDSPFEIPEYLIKQTY